MLVIVGPLSAAILSDLRENDIQYENFVGVDHAFMMGLYRDVDIISFPSIYEGFGMPILEGQAMGRPVLTSNLDPMRSVAGQGGALLVNPESVDAIREGFQALIGNGILRDRLVTAGMNNCRQYTLERIVSRYRALYSSFGISLDGVAPQPR
jgi:glycosyltransferase involved in cell wall biosynthesis